jgi:hypothetical protein
MVGEINAQRFVQIGDLLDEMQDPAVAKKFPGITLHLIREHFEELYATALSIRCVRRILCVCVRAHTHTCSPMTRLHVSECVQKKGARHSRKKPATASSECEAASYRIFSPKLVNRNL